MGSVEGYDTRAGHRYRVLWRRPDHAQTSKRGFRTKRDAELFLAAQEVSKAQGLYVDPSKARITVAAWMGGWLDERADLRATTRERVAGIVERQIVPELGRYPLGELTHQRCQQWAGRLSERQSPASVRKIAGVLSGALQAAVRDGRLAVNPAHGLKLPKVGKASKRYLNHEQVRDLAAAVEQIGAGRQNGRQNGYGTLVRVLAYCGLRWGEVAGLRACDVDLRRGRLEVRHTVVEVGGVHEESTPKDYEARSIPVPASVLRELAQLVDGKSPRAPVFAGARSGSWLRGRAFRRGWLDEAAVSIGVPGLTPHELRHTAASLAISAGANVKAV